MQENQCCMGDRVEQLHRVQLVCIVLFCAPNQPREWPMKFLVLITHEWLPNLAWHARVCQTHDRCFGLLFGVKGLSVSALTCHHGVVASAPYRNVFRADRVLYVFPWYHCIVHVHLSITYHYEAIVTERDKRILFDFVDACASPECPICQLVQRAERRTVAVYCIEGSADQQRRAQVRAARGLCAHHGELLRDAKDAMAAAVTALDVMTNLLRDMPALALPPTLIRRHHRPRPCPVCAEMRQYDHAVCAGVVAWHDDPDLLAALAQSQGICAPHLRYMAAHWRMTTPWWDAQRTAWMRIHTELEEFVRKRDDRFRHEPHTSDADAWKRAWMQISGTAD
jgi:hypothetical protein